LESLFLSDIELTPEARVILQASTLDPNAQTELDFGSRVRRRINVIKVSQPV